MLDIFSREIIDKREETIFSTRLSSDKFLRILVDYLVESNSIITTLLFTECPRISVDGINYLIEKWGPKIVVLEFSGCGLTDNDLTNLRKLTNLKRLYLEENNLTTTTLEMVKSMNLNYVKIDYKDANNQPQSYEYDKQAPQEGAAILTSFNRSRSPSPSLAEGDGLRTRRAFAS